MTESSLLALMTASCVVITVRNTLWAQVVVMYIAPNDEI